MLIVEQLEIVHRYVEQMDKYYGNVCELDIIFNFQKAYFIMDELLLAGEMQESSKKNVLRVISAQDSIEDTEVSQNKIFHSGDQGVNAANLRGKQYNVWGVPSISDVLTHNPFPRSMRKLRRSCESRTIIHVHRIYIYGWWLVGVWRLAIHHNFNTTCHVLC